MAAMTLRKYKQSRKMRKHPRKIQNQEEWRSEERMCAELVAVVDEDQT